MTVFRTWVGFGLSRYRLVLAVRSTCRAHMSRLCTRPEVVPGMLGNLDYNHKLQFAIQSLLRTSQNCVHKVSRDANFRAVDAGRRPQKDPRQGQTDPVGSKFRPRNTESLVS
jgi:hypothetical protein